MCGTASFETRMADRFLPLAVGGRQQVAAAAKADVVDQDVDAAECLDGPRHDGGGACHGADIRVHRADATRRTSDVAHVA
jgi:hypothetical protein